MHFKAKVLSVNIQNIFSTFTELEKLSLVLIKPIHYPIAAPIHRPINSSELLSLPPCPHHDTEHKEVRSCSSSSFSLMLMHILSLLHTNVSWPRLAVCLLLDHHLFSWYWLQFNLTLVTVNMDLLPYSLFTITQSRELCLKIKRPVIFLCGTEGDSTRTILNDRTSQMMLDQSCGWQNIRLFLPGLNWFNLEPVSLD